LPEVDRRSVDALPFEVESDLDTIGNFYEWNTAIHSVLLVYRAFFQPVISYDYSTPENPPESALSLM